jgi:hypothetical protein
MRFHDVIGIGASVETAPGVWDDVIVERKFRGDVVRNTRKYSEGESVNDNLSVGNSVTVVSDEYLMGHIADMRYVKVAGSLWRITDVEIERPRLILRLGGVYNGPTAPAPDTP